MVPMERDGAARVSRYQAKVNLNTFSRFWKTRLVTGLQLGPGGQGNGGLEYVSSIQEGIGF